MLVIIGIVIFLILAVLVAIGGSIQGYQDSKIKRAKYKAAQEYLRMDKERERKRREEIKQRRLEEKQNK